MEMQLYGLEGHVQKQHCNKFCASLIHCQFFSRIRQQSIASINSLCTLKASAVQRLFDFNVFLNQCRAVKKQLPSMAIPAVMLQDAFPLFPPLGDGPFLDAMEYIGV